MDIDRINASLAAANDAMEGVTLASFGTLIDEQDFDVLFGIEVEENVLGDDVVESSPTEQEFVSYLAKVSHARQESLHESDTAAFDAVMRVAKQLEDEGELPPVPMIEVATDGELAMWIAAARGVDFEKKVIEAHVIGGAPPVVCEVRFPSWWPSKSDVEGPARDVVMFIDDFTDRINPRLQNVKFTNAMEDGDEILSAQIGGGWRRGGLELSISLLRGMPTATMWLSDNLMARAPKQLVVMDKNNNEVEYSGFSGAKLASLINDLVDKQ